MSPILSGLNALLLMTMPYLYFILLFTICPVEDLPEPNSIMTGLSEVSTTKSGFCPFLYDVNDNIPSGNSLFKYMTTVSSGIFDICSGTRLFPNNNINIDFLTEGDIKKAFFDFIILPFKPP